MNESDKPFACAKQGCKMAFTNEDHLNVHKKKHAMALHLGIDNENNTIVADQTPTPTRFIRNCEEVGLFQDLQNVNPFDETFRKATELVKTGSLYIPNNTSNDDTLHTPHIFPHIEEGNNINKFSRNISNDPEFSVTTIDDNLLKLSDKNTNDELKNDIDIEELSLSSEPEKSNRNTFLPDSDPVISSHSTSISNINYVVPPAVPVTISINNSDIPPAVVNNLSDIIKQNCINKAETDGEEMLKLRLEEAIRNEVKTEESESDDCDAMVIHDMETSPLFTNNVSQRLIKSPKKKVPLKRAIKENLKKKTDICNARQSKIVFSPSIIKSKTDKNETRSKVPITQTQLERQREVNRAAQIRSREKKKIVINKMETEIQVLKEEKRELWVENQNLKDEIVWLKSMLLYHTNCPVARDPEIKAEINQMVKLSQDELRKKMEKNPLPKKFVPIRPNPATNLISVTPVTGSVYVQVPAPVSKSFSLLASKSIPTSVDSPTAMQLHSLPTLTSKPSTTIMSSEKNLVPTTVAVMPTLLPGSVPPLSPLSIQTVKHNSVKPVTVPTESTPKLMIQLPENTNSSTQTLKHVRRQPKILKANSRLKTNHQRDNMVLNVKTNQVMMLPNAAHPDNNYFILAKPRNFTNM